MERQGSVSMGHLEPMDKGVRRQCGHNKIDAIEFSFGNKTSLTAAMKETFRRTRTIVFWARAHSKNIRNREHWT